MENKMKLVASPELAENVRKDVEKEKKDILLIEKTKDGKEVYCIENLRDREYLKKEIGRLREETFRIIGEGTGNERDLDEFDDIYVHIVVWAPEKQKIVGAYRLGKGFALCQKEKKGIYSETLFNFSEEFKEKFLKNGIELGRSFIVPEYQKERFSLDNLFRGIAKFIEKEKKENPSLRYLFGPVSISNLIDKRYQEMLIYYCKKNFDGKGFPKKNKEFVKGKNEKKIAKEEEAKLEEIFSKENLWGNDFQKIKRKFQEGNQYFPILFKQYANLCENEGIWFVSFNTDPDFSDSVDGFLILDLEKLKPEVKKWYDIAI